MGEVNLDAPEFVRHLDDRQQVSNVRNVVLQVHHVTVDQQPCARGGSTSTKKELVATYSLRPPRNLRALRVKVRDVLPQRCLSRDP